ncbi:Cof-type HAD-IIB family hydrolase [uncultured Brachyspira sp.]|uniref:Cof-type HAD-IIB family hydrolase n=1 Tax=uncultured Brachyspira sp. TaxID=221953 RepID=UPI0025E64722|nr:Cof-type HAD-IIB family hydrolase [uncultured Brachyspira sp.]
MIKAAFFDVDGTLVNFKDRKISDSSKKAIKELRENGIKVFVASGRALFQIEDLVDFDGYITVNGCNCFVDEDNELKEIYRVSLDKDDLFSLVDYLDKDRFLCSVITSKDIFINYIDDDVKKMYDENKIVIPESVNFREYINKNYEQILQLNIFVDENKESYLINNVLKNSKSSRWNPNFADVNSKHGGKEVGVNKIIEYYKIDLSEIIAFGDGGNDIGMIKAAGIGVAMGNANDSVKEVADYITDDVDNDGVCKALKHYGLIS